MNWTKTEIQLLKDNFPKMEDRKLSRIIRKSPNALRIKASRLKIIKETSEIRSDLRINEIEEQIILGGLLGDLYCGYSKTSKYPRLQGAHGKDQKEYVFWKIKLLNRLRFRQRVTKIGAYWYESKTFKALTEYYQLFYSNKYKQVNEQILSRLNDFGLLIWYLDDGSYSKRDHYITFYTNGFTYNEQVLISNWFKNRYNLSPKIGPIRNHNYPNKIWYCLRFNVIDSKKLIDIFKQFEIPSCMEYKLGEFSKNLHSTNFNEKNELKLII